MTNTAVVLGMAPAGKPWPASVCDCAKDRAGNTAMNKAIINFIVVSSRFSFAIWYHRVPLKRWYHSVPEPSKNGMNKTSISKRQEGKDETAVRERILEAAFAEFMKNGYATASMLEIATRARVSKRELYALVGNKQKMLIACISERAKRFDVPTDLPVGRDRETLEQVLTSFGTKLVREISD